MRAITDWLAKVEHRAYGIYAKAADAFRKEPPLSSFLRDLASDELCHEQFVKAAAKAMNDTGADDDQAPVHVDGEARKRIEEHFSRAESALSHGTMKREQIVDYIVNTEFSEWNDLHLYVMGKAQERGPLFMRMGAAIEMHRRYITQFLETLPEGRERLEGLKKMPPVWRERILIVDDAPSIARLLSAVCRELGDITIAQNGADALERLRKSYYDAIVSDIDMPVMNGMEFFRKATADDPFVRDRMVFFTGYLSDEVEKFVRQHKLRYLEKPAGISKIKQVVSEILRQSTRRVEAATPAGTAPLGCLEAFLVSQIAGAAGMTADAEPS